LLGSFVREAAAAAGTKLDTLPPALSITTTMATSTTTAASNHTEVVASSSDSVAESLDITPKKKRSSSKRSKRRVNAVSEDDPLIIVDPGSNFENLDRRYSYHIDVSTRQLVVQGAKELLEKPYKHRFYASIIVNCTIVAILTAANLAALIYHLVTWTLPGRLVLYGLIILMTLGMLACAATTWTALMVARVAADNIMNLRYNQSWYDHDDHGWDYYCCYYHSSSNKTTSGFSCVAIE